MLKPAPTRVRTESFSQEVRQWLVSSHPPVQYVTPIRTEHPTVREESYKSIADIPGSTNDAQAALHGEQQRAGEMYPGAPAADVPPPFLAPERVVLPLSERVFERSEAPT